MASASLLKRMTKIQQAALQSTTKHSRSSRREN
jgi:hypothetical protein